MFNWGLTDNTKDSLQTNKLDSAVISVDGMVSLNRNMYKN